MAVIGLALLWLAGADLPALAEDKPGVAAYAQGDYKAALPLLEQDAATGDAAAQTKLGLIHAKGLGVPKDPKKALPWFQKAAAQGYAEAQYCVGVVYDIGDGVAQDHAAAASWYRKAATQGYLKAQINLANMLDRGDGVPQDQAEGAIWYRKAAEQGDIDSQNYLAHLHLKGLGVERNILTAKMWIERAAAQNDPAAKKGAAYLAEEFAKFEKDGVIPRLAGGDGSSMKDAISFPDIKHGGDGVSAEHQVVAFFFSEWSWESQALLGGEDGLNYDAITLRKGGDEKILYFDVTFWFGKLE
jgi:TPR repeat protein